MNESKMLIIVKEDKEYTISVTHKGTNESITGKVKSIYTNYNYDYVVEFENGEKVILIPHS